MKHVIKNAIYKVKRGHEYDSEQKQYNCFAPALTGKFYAVDCWVCDEKGNIHPGYNACPVIVYTSVLRETVGMLGDEYDEYDETGNSWYVG